MKAMQSLIRLHRWQADEKRRELAELEAMREDLLLRHSVLQAEIQAEQAVAQQAVVQFSYATYARAAIGRRETLSRSIADVEQAIEAKQDELADAVRELKKFELVAARRAEREREDANRREQLDVDEVALNLFRRRG